MNDLITKSFITLHKKTKSFMSYVDLFMTEAMKDLEAGPDFDLEISSTAKTMDQNLSLFLEETEKVKQEMEVIRDLLAKLQESNKESKSLHHERDSLKALRNKINNDIVTVLKKARTIKSQIEEMDPANAANKHLSGCKEGTVAYRSRIAVTNGLRNMLKELLIDFQGLRQKMKTDHKKKVRRWYHIVTGENPDEETIEKMISDGVTAEDFLTHAIEDEPGNVLETVQVEIQDRDDAAKLEIEKGLLERLLLDMDVMMEAQGDHGMDDIEHHMMNASYNVMYGSQELHIAKKYQRSSRIGICLLLNVIVVTVIPIATSFAFRRSSQL